jgi:hypothetical protein
MRIPTVALSLVTALALTIAPIASASARGWDHWGHRGGGWVGPGLVVGAVAGAAAALVTAPFALAGAVLAPPAPVYAAPAPAVYAAPAYGYPGYYGYPQPRRVVYAYPQPAYYAPYGYAPY